jgi:hypothetical protein
MTILGSIQFGSQSGFPTTLSTSIDLGASANRWLLVFTSVIGGSSSVNHTGATIGGVALTAHGNASMQTLLGTPGTFGAFSLAGGTVPSGVQTLNITRDNAAGWNQIAYVVWGDGQSAISAPTAFTLAAGANFAASRSSAAGELVLALAHMEGSGAGPVTITPTAPASGLSGTGSGAAVQRLFGLHTAGAATTNMAAVIAGNQFTPSSVYRAWSLAPVGGGDTAAPTMTGALSVAGVGYRLAWSAGSDNVGVTGYEVSVNGGTSYTNVGNVLFYDVTNRVAGTTDLVRVRAYDAAGNRSAHLSGSVQLSTTGAPATTALVLVIL